ncbi:hypothetical protein RAJCM14343_3938 [Rhodococcus aetherivorans]|uniref:Uncharacterized protein n=1 Tax=Rhodococcus aetherivorans TaxID=191292 RepID=A0ABQ0YPZ2_9NOCA|nr:hypothetical protein RAJCM14343_3938 [Rhodococcus aetherivorans]
MAEDYKLKFESCQRRVNTLEHEIETIEHIRNVADQMRWRAL